MSSLRDYGLAAPHGPNMDSHHVATEQLYAMSQNEQGVFQTILKPDDSYDEHGTYWADMPIMKRIAFVNKVNNAEAKKEWNSTLAMIKKDPLSPLGYYMRNMVIPGMGLLLEGYVLFSIETSSLSSRLLSLLVGRRRPSVTAPGLPLLITSRLSASLLVKSSSVSLVTGSVVVGV